jgi:uncharacterized membrane protein YGL010W
VKRLAVYLTQYAAYHRDRRNIATHFAGIPMILFAGVLALATVTVPAGPVAVTLAAVACIAASAWWIALDLALGATLALALFVMCAAASEITARMGTGAVLAASAAVFVAGWALQFLGHKYEGLKPAFYDDAKQLLVGPLFVCAEVFFILGAKPQLRRYIEERVGPTLARRDGAPIGNSRGPRDDRPGEGADPA